MTLNEVMKDTADAIREKTGKSELIGPVDFASEIKGITAGGSGESGEKAGMTYVKKRGFFRCIRSPDARNNTAGRVKEYPTCYILNISALWNEENLRFYPTI